MAFISTKYKEEYLSDGAPRRNEDIETIGLESITASKNDHLGKDYFIIKFEYIFRGNETFDPKKYWMFDLKTKRDCELERILKEIDL